MPAKHKRYLRRNEKIGQRRVYICHPGMARLTINGFEILDGTMATITDAFDFDFPFLYTLDGGRLATRGGGLGWIGPNGEFDTFVLVQSVELFMAKREYEAREYFMREVV